MKWDYEELSKKVVFVLMLRIVFFVLIFSFIYKDYIDLEF